MEIICVLYFKCITVVSNPSHKFIKKNYEVAKTIKETENSAVHAPMHQNHRISYTYEWKIAENWKSA